MKASSVYLFITLSAFFFVNSVLCDVLPVPGDCRKYQMCDYSGCYVFNCGIGTEFNPRVKICDYPLGDRSSCGSRSTLGTITDSVTDILGAIPSYSGNQNPSYTYPGNQAPPVNYYPNYQGRNLDFRG